MRYLRVFQAKTQVTALFEALPQAEKDAMLPKAATNARPGESTNRKALTTVPSQASPSAISEDVSAKPPNATSSDKSVRASYNVPGYCLTLAIF